MISKNASRISRSLDKANVASTTAFAHFLLPEVLNASLGCDLLYFCANKKHKTFQPKNVALITQKTLPSSSYTAEMNPFHGSRTHYSF